MQRRRPRLGSLLEGLPGVPGAWRWAEHPSAVETCQGWKLREVKQAAYRGSLLKMWWKFQFWIVLIQSQARQMGAFTHIYTPPAVETILIVQYRVNQKNFDHILWRLDIKHLLRQSGRWRFASAAVDMAADKEKLQFNRNRALFRIIPRSVICEYVIVRIIYDNMIILYNYKITVYVCICLVRKS